MPRLPSYANVALSLAHLCDLDVPPGTLVECAARAGFASIGLRTRAAAPGGIEYPLATRAEQADFRARTAATGVALLYIELVSLSETTGVEDCRSMLESGAVLGATRLAVAGDSANFDLVAEKLASLCDLAAQYGIAVDLEFMPFRAVASLDDAIEVVTRAGRPNAHILIDALHVFRSGSSLQALARLDRGLIGTVQLCDAPRALPADLDLVTEARSRRLLPGTGELSLWPLIEALPADVPIGVEVPLGGLYPSLEPLARLTRLARSTRAFLEPRSSS